LGCWHATLPLLSQHAKQSHGNGRRQADKANALIATVVRWAAWLFPDSLALAIREETTLLALVLLSVTIGMKVFGSGKVTLDRISGAVTLYLLVGLICAVVFQLISLRIPEAFSGIPHDEVRTDSSI
jgi:hypothetical protein